MDEERLKAVLESLLFAAGEPVSLARLAAVLDPVTKEAIRKALGDLKAGFYREGRGVMLDEVAGGFQLRTPKEHALYVRLAIIAYRQPITRPEIEQLRGVDSGAVLETLTERRLVKIAGRKEAPGRPLMYATTSEFLQTFGLKDLDSLPDLVELREVEQQIENAEQERLAEQVEEHAPEQLDLMPVDAGQPEPAIIEPEGAVAEEVSPAESESESKQSGEDETSS